MSGRAAIAVVALCACGPVAPDGPPGDSFLAFATDFRGYKSWESFALPNQGGDGNVHLVGDRTVYLKQRPPMHETAFPIGTLIVKELPGQDQILARAKRGGGFNAAGCGWEWFELKPTTGDEVTLVWRGLGPPAGEGYGGDPTACNGCHAGAKANDCVSTAALELGGL